MKDGWKRAGVITGVAVISYMVGHTDGGAPAGTPKPSVSAVQNARETGTQYVHEANSTAQTLLAEAGTAVAVGGNAASGAGTGVQNTVPGAPPQAG